jgi:hypothetical protein
MDYTNTKFAALQQQQKQILIEQLADAGFEDLKKLIIHWMLLSVRKVLTKNY